MWLSDEHTQELNAENFGSLSLQHFLQSSHISLCHALCWQLLFSLTHMLLSFLLICVIAVHTRHLMTHSEYYSLRERVKRIPWFSIYSAENTEVPTKLLQNFIDCDSSFLKCTKFGCSHTKFSASQNIVEHTYELMWYLATMKLCSNFIGICRILDFLNRKCCRK